MVTTTPARWPPNSNSSPNWVPVRNRSFWGGLEPSEMDSVFCCPLIHDKEAALELVRYLESGAKGDNTNYGYVDIYSSFKQVTWGDLEIEVISDIDISLKETNGNISYFEVEYYVNSKNMYGTQEMYKVKEYYRTRYTSTRTYLLNFERTMEQYFEPVSENIQSGRINLGITENADFTECEAAESPSGKRVCS